MVDSTAVQIPPKTLQTTHKGSQLKYTRPTEKDFCYIKQ